MVGVSCLLFLAFDVIYIRCLCVVRFYIVFCSPIPLSQLCYWGKSSILSVGVAIARGYRGGAESFLARGHGFRW